MEIKFNGYVTVPDSAMDSASDLDHAVLNAIQSILSSAVNSDDAYKRLDMDYVPLGEVDE